MQPGSPIGLPQDSHKPYLPAAIFAKAFSVSANCSSICRSSARRFPTQSFPLLPLPVYHKGCLRAVLYLKPIRLHLLLFIEQPLPFDFKASLNLSDVTVHFTTPSRAFLTGNNQTIMFLSENIWAILNSPRPWL